MMKLIKNLHKWIVTRRGCGIDVYLVQAETKEEAIELATNNTVMYVGEFEITANKIDEIEIKNGMALLGSYWE